jgi:hypothetical protein
MTLLSIPESAMGLEFRRRDFVASVASAATRSASNALENKRCRWKFQRHGRFWYISATLRLCVSALLLGMQNFWKRITQRRQGAKSQRVILLFILLASSLHATKENNVPDDQLLVIYGSSGYVLYKVLDFANDHGFRYVKILSYEFDAFGHTISGKSKTSSNGGRFFELRDENAKVSFLCFEELPQDIYVIDVKQYQFILDDIAVQAESQ